MLLKAIQIAGCYEIQPHVFSDDRGKFIKTYHEEVFRQNQLNTVWNEEYYSISHNNVIRGMHFQLPPHDHEKLVYCVSGSVLDVVVDLRKESPTFRQHVKVNLSAQTHNMLYIPKGCAHGFKALEDNTAMLYKVATVYNPSADCGILWDSCSIDWQLESDPIISSRDQSFTKLGDFNSPF
jgi:dTDP-4-dehydrorhamnose 3,5-epimerase